MSKVTKISILENVCYTYYYLSLDLAFIYIVIDI